MNQLIQNASISLQFILLSKPTICVNLDRFDVPVYTAGLKTFRTHLRNKYSE